jgi:hypothetical protein
LDGRPLLAAPPSGCALVFFDETAADAAKDISFAANTGGSNGAVGEVAPPVVVATATAASGFSFRGVAAAPKKEAIEGCANHGWLCLVCAASVRHFAVSAWFTAAVAAVSGARNKAPLKSTETAMWSE